jgi:hypothetical protein
MENNLVQAMAVIQTLSIPKPSERQAWQQAERGCHPCMIHGRDGYMQSTNKGFM